MAGTTCLHKSVLSIVVFSLLLVCTHGASVLNPREDSTEVLIGSKDETIGSTDEPTSSTGSVGSSSEAEAAEYMTQLEAQ